jgi:putative ATP-binding cassette transporter
MIGRRLVRLNFNQLRYEADFRYSLVHVRDNAESIAFYQGEKSERREIGKWFSNVLSNFSLLIGWQRNLSFFTTAHSYLPVVLPYLILFPAYFSGKIDYGDMLQANFAFAQVYAALAQIISRFDQITTFTAGVDRLAAFSESLKPVDPSTHEDEKEITSLPGDRFSLENLTLQTPDRMRTLFRNMTVSPAPSDNLLIVGPSGVGKSSLIRAIAGLWTAGEGQVTRPDPGDILFLPQKPYMTIGSLRDQLCYPRSPENMTDQDLRSVLESVNLTDLPDRLGGFETVLDWADVLSLGEQQRLSFARLLVSRPRFAILDEATSALDARNEALVYSLLTTLGIRFISVGHRPGIVDFHTHVIELRTDGNWSLMTVLEYKTREA